MAEQDEIAGLDRVLTRLALTDESSLQKASIHALFSREPSSSLQILEGIQQQNFFSFSQVLDKLLPLVINKLQTSHHALRQKVLNCSMLGHYQPRLMCNINQHVQEPLLL